MRFFLNFLIVCLLALIAFSCKSSSSDLALLHRCESVAYTQPELAMDRLDSIQFPEDFHRDARFRYLLRITQLRHQLGKDIADDLRVPEATTYFTSKENWEYAALSEYCLGCILMDKAKFDQAILKFQAALKLVDNEENNALKGLILLNMGQLQMKQSEWPLADRNIQRGRICFQRSGNLDLEVEALLFLGEIREQIGDYSLAKQYRLNALMCRPKPEGTAKCYLELSQLYYIMGQKDSVNHYAALLRRTLPKVNDPVIQSNCWQFLSNWYQEDGKTQDANLSKAQFNHVFKELLSGKSARSLLNETVKLEQVRKLYMTRLESNKIWLNSMIILCMLIIIFFLLRNKRHRNALQEAELEIVTLQNLASEFERKEDNLRQLALKHFDILKKVALLDGMMKDLKGGQEKKIMTLFNQAVYENNPGFDWDTFFKSLNQLKNGIPEKVWLQYPQLTETEYRILILSFTGLSNKETSIILHLSTNTINSLRTSVRRKLQVPEYGDLEEFVTNQLNNLQ